MAVKLPSNFNAWMPRALLLLAIWGIAVFLWGTFGAWTNKQQLDNEVALAAANERFIKGWLDQNIVPLERLANDERLAAGMGLPAGVESLPIQRVLYEYAYLTGQSQVYIADLGRRRIGRTAGAEPLPSEVLPRLADMPDSDKMVLGYGQRSGQLLLIHKVKAPLPLRLYVMVPIGLTSLAATLPVLNLPEQRELTLVLPHTIGWAQWHLQEAGYDLDDGLMQAVQDNAHVYVKDPWMLVLSRISGWPDVRIGIQSPNKMIGTKLLPQVLVALWAIMMSLAVLWKNTEAYRLKALTLTAPALAPFGKMGKPLSIAVEKIAARVRSSWKDVNAETPLVDGPGAFDQRDFASVEMMQRSHAGPRKSRGSANLKLSQSPSPQADKLERRKRARGNDAGRLPPKMNWPDKPVAPDLKALKEEREHPIDPEDLKAVVEDCLKKKRILLLYQPIYSVRDNMPVMHEVYARLQRSDGVIIPPDQFLPITVRHKLTLDLDIAVLRRVVHEHFSSGSNPVTPLALNISSTSLDGIAYLQEMANQGPRVLQKLGFEVRSQEMIRDPKALKLLKDLQRHGGNLAVDYFGGGTAMLDASKAMGFNYVKLNALRLMTTDAGKKELITLCQYARNIGLPVIVEMVGDAETLSFVKRAGAAFLQGYALKRPENRMTTSPLPPTL